MLSERDRQVLHEVEHRMAATDPKLAKLLAKGPCGRRRTQIAQNVLIIVTSLASVVCLEFSHVWGALISLLLAAVLMAVRVRGGICWANG
jgi:Protein of unknown function (DUF3040)